VVTVCAIGAAGIGHAASAAEGAPPPPAAAAKQPATPPAPASVAKQPAPPTPVRNFPVLEYQVEGNTLLQTIDVERAVMSHLGESRTVDDVEAARKELEKGVSRPRLQDRRGQYSAAGHRGSGVVRLPTAASVRAACTTPLPMACCGILTTTVL